MSLSLQLPAARASPSAPRRPRCEPLSGDALNHVRQCLAKEALTPPPFGTDVDARAARVTSAFAEAVAGAATRAPCPWKPWVSHASFALVRARPVDADRRVSSFSDAYDSPACRVACVVWAFLGGRVSLVRAFACVLASRCARVALLGIVSR